MRWLVLALLLLLPLSAAENWGALQPLIGRWVGEGVGDPGQGSGGFSFEPDLQGKILVRKNFAEYAAAAGKPASRHDDLMIVFREDPAESLRAMYFDNEGHVIRYTVREARGSVIFESDGPGTVTRYRMTYKTQGTDRLTLQFEIAPPGKDFAPYIQATARRAP